MTTAVAISLVVALVTITTTLVGVVVWAIRLEGRVNVLEKDTDGRLKLQAERHDSLSEVVENVKVDVREAIREVKTSNEKLFDKVEKEFRYVKGRIDGIAASVGEKRLRRQNEDDEANRDGA